MVTDKIRSLLQKADTGSERGNELSNGTKARGDDAGTMRFGADARQDGRINLGIGLADGYGARRDTDLGFVDELFERQTAAGPELDVRATQADHRPPLDPMNPRSAVDPDMASPDEVVGRTGGPDPFRAIEPSERLTVAQPFEGRGLRFL